jgi:hypothetical protein
MDHILPSMVECNGNMLSIFGIDRIFEISNTSGAITVQRDFPARNVKLTQQTPKPSGFLNRSAGSNKLSPDCGSSNTGLLLTPP